MGALIPHAGKFSAAVLKTSTSRSPAFASSMIFLAIISSVRSPGRLMAARAVSNAMPTRRAVSGSKVWPFRKGLMGTRASPSRQAETKARQFHYKRCETKTRIKAASQAGNGIDVLVFRKPHATRGVTPALARSTYAEEKPRQITEPERAAARAGARYAAACTRG